MKKLLLIATFLIVLASCEKEPEGINVWIIDQTEKSWRKIEVEVNGNTYEVETYEFLNGYKLPERIPINGKFKVFLTDSAYQNYELDFRDLTITCKIYFRYPGFWSFRYEYITDWE